MSQAFQFQLKNTDGKARLGQISMPRGEIRTPVHAGRHGRHRQSHVSRSGP